MIGSVLFASSQEKLTPLGPRHRLSFGEKFSIEESVGASRLGKFGLFSGLDTEAIAEIAGSAKQRSVKGGTRIIRQGQVGKEIFLLEDGSVGIYAENGDAAQLIVVLDGPTVFGEMAVVTRERIRTASVEAITDLKILSIPINKLIGYLKRFEPLRTNLRRMIAARKPKQ